MSIGMPPFLLLIGAGAMGSVIGWYLIYSRHARNCIGWPSAILGMMVGVVPAITVFFAGSYPGMLAYSVGLLLGALGDAYFLYMVRRRVGRRRFG